MTTLGMIKNGYNYDVRMTYEFQCYVWCHVYVWNSQCYVWCNFYVWRTHYVKMINPWNHARMFTSGAHACWSPRALKVEGYATSLSWTSLSLAYVTWQKCCVYVTWQGTHVRTCMHDVQQRLSDCRTCTCMCGQMQEVTDDKHEFRLFLHRAIPSAMINVA